ncbi:InlB B-repeat-containing protein [Olsenella sp. An270]|uniref:InlB B-repeat-containing protein n=1 Tax=Olsenella sp. An270 TaxID=1965615 RepID=UPI000B3A9A63|nr:InlB B-repeat-containing protein [Olsenella sp. An270]OUO58317.1 hypothetical protein B5F73_08655 [Olsenella sp. An270]
MSERREGGYRKRRELMKKGKAALAVFLSIVLVMQSSNIQAFAEGLTVGSSERTEQVVMDTPAESAEATVTEEPQTETSPVSEITEPQVTEQSTEPVATEEPAETTEPVQTEVPQTETPVEATPTETPVETTTDAPADTSAPVVEDNTATLTFDVTGATLTYSQNGEKSVTADTADKTVELDSTLDFKFTVSPDDGQQIASVKAVTSDGAESDVTANESGEYTLPAANVTDGTTIRVTTEAVPTEETTETDDTTVEDEETTPVTLSVEVENSTVTLTNAEGEEQKVSESQDVEVAADEDLALTVEPAEDYELESVTVTDVDETSEVSGEDGVYTIPADQVIEGSNIQVSAVNAAKAQGARATSQTLNVDDQVPVHCTNNVRRHDHSWTSSNSQVATVTTNKDGRGIFAEQRANQTVTAVAPGDAEIKCGDTVILSVHVEVSEITVNFDPNDGQGERFTKTTSEMENGNYRMSLPTLEESGFSRDGYTFVGWSTDRTGEGQTYTPQEITVSDGQTYYAIWAKNDAEGEVRAEFFLRIRGDIPYEPDANIGGGGAGYFPGGCGTGMWGSIKQGVAINNNNALVAANINEAPSDATIQTKIQEWNRTHAGSDKMSYNPGTQEIVWYVIKKSGDHYHVDGVIVDKAEHWVSYNPNGGTSHVPTGKQYMEGATVDVDFTAIPSKAGYTFLGWDTNRNATTPTYTEDGTNSFDMPDHDVTLYAIWSANNQTPYIVEYYYEGDDGSFELKKEETRRAKTDSQVSVNESDKTPDTGYYFDESNADNVLSGTVSGEGDLVLKLYFAKQHEITVEAKSDTVKYSGDEQSVSGIVTDTFVVEGNTYTVEGLTASAEGTDAGEYTANVTGTAVVKDAEGHDVTDQFVVKTQAGKLTIEKRQVTLTSATDSKVYDGKPLTNDGVTVSGDGWATGEGATYDVTGSQTLVGGSPNSFDYTLNEGTDADNYNITKAPGQLTVTARPDEAKFEITVVANSGTEKYDGTEKSVSGLEKTEFEFDGVKYTVEGLTASAEGTDAGEYTANVTGTAVVKDAEGHDVTDQFVVKTQAGKLKITAVPITITTESATKVYDGTELTAGGKIEGLIEGDATFTVTGTQTTAGSSDNTYTLIFAANKRSNYSTITTNIGTLTVTAQSITPGPDPDNPDPSYVDVQVDYPADVPYNGQDQTWEPTVTSGETTLVKDQDYTVSYSTEDRTNVTGAITVTITGAGNYSGTVTRTYQVLPLTITVTPDSVSKYVGQADPTLTSTYDGYIQGETAGWTGSLTREPGEAVGTYVISQGDLQLADNPDGNFLAQNYNLVVNNGVFTILDAPVTPGDGGGTPTPTPTPTPVPGGGTPTPVPGTPVTVTTGDDTTDDTVEPEEAIEDDTTPMAGPTETIDDGDTPLAAGKHEDCWVHWIILIGMILSSVYFVGVSVRRRKFTSSLLGYENKVLDNDRDNA